jgi:hypothetical protein
MNLPNLVIGGAPKCGTSSFFNWLADHPDVCGSDVKETFYLMDPGHSHIRPHSNYHDHGLAGYAAHFQQCGAGKVVVEGTTHYLYQQTARDVLAELSPVPTIVFVLREPARRVYSSYQFHRNNTANIDKSVSFAQHVDILMRGDQAALSRNYAPKSIYTLQHDIRYSQYIDYLPAWISSLGRERVHVYLMEHMVRRPRDFMWGFCAQVGIDPDFYATYAFDKKNETVQIKNQSLHRQAWKIGRRLSKNPLKSLLKAVYYRLQAAAPESMTDDDKSTLNMLAQYYQPYNRRLTEELGIDLTAWETSRMPTGKVEVTQ